MALVKINVDTSRFSKNACLNLLAPSENYGVSVHATLANGVSDQEPTTGNGWSKDLFQTASDIQIAKYIEIYSDKELTVKCNLNTNDAMTVRAGVSKVIDWLLVEALFISNGSGNAADVEIIIAGGK